MIVHLFVHALGMPVSVGSVLYSPSLTYPSSSWCLIRFYVYLCLRISLHSLCIPIVDTQARKEDSGEKGARVRRPLGRHCHVSVDRRQALERLPVPEGELAAQVPEASQDKTEAS